MRASRIGSGLAVACGWALLARDESERGAKLREALQLYPENHTAKQRLEELEGQ